VSGFTKEERFCIRQMVKKGYQTRTIAQMLDKDVLDVHEYINKLFSKDPTARPDRKEKRGIPHYNDPRSAETGSRLLLEALNKYFEKHKARCP
jgi:hypothetical protein